MSDSNEYEDMESLAGLFEQADELEEDDSVDFDSSRAQDDGWVKFYVECYECEVPMAQTGTKSSHTTDDGVRVTEMEIRCVCPNCREVGASMTVELNRGPLSDVFNELHSFE